MFGRIFSIIRRNKGKEMPSHKGPSQLPSSTVKFNIMDGKKPTRDHEDPSQIFSLLAPVSLRLARGEEREVRLGVSCSHPVHVLQYAKKSHLIRLVDGVWAAQDRDQELVLKIKNVSDQDPLLLEEGEVLARAAVFCNASVAVVY
jgi:hypothetical protein